MPENWVETVTKNVEEVVKESKNYNIFRYDIMSNMPESVGSKLIEQTVIDNKNKIIEKVNEIIDDKLNKDSENKEQFVERLIDSFYNTFTVKFDRGDK
jgi:ribosomal protein L1